MCEQHKGLTELELGRAINQSNNKPPPRWTGEVRLVPKALEKPFGWGSRLECPKCGWTSIRKRTPKSCPGCELEGAGFWRHPLVVLTPSMSDMFHEDVPDEYIAAWFGVMAACPEHTFLVLTKRIERALRWLSPDGWLGSNCQVEDGVQPLNVLGYWARAHGVSVAGRDMDPVGAAFPLPNVIICTTVEDQPRADERLPVLAEIAALGWRTGVSVEPLLEGVKLGLGRWIKLTRRVAADWPKPPHSPATLAPAGSVHLAQSNRHGALSVETSGELLGVKPDEFERVDPEFIAVGGESGPGARPCHIDWIRSVVEQCREAGVSCHSKQLGTEPRCGEADLEHYGQWLNLGHGVYKPAIESRSGGDPEEFPPDLQVRELPNARANRA